MFLRQQYVSGLAWPGLAWPGLAWRNSWCLQNRSIDNSPGVPVGSPCHDELMANGLTANLPSVNGWRAQVVFLQRHQHSALCIVCFWLNNTFRNFRHQKKEWNVLCWICYMNLVVIQVHTLTAATEHSRAGRPSLQTSSTVWWPKNTIQTMTWRSINSDAIS
jgi:hypothetical protein